MRVAPVALFFHPDRERLSQQAGISARVTHTHPLGIDGALLQAAAVSLALNRTAPGRWQARLLEQEIDLKFKEKLKLLVPANLLTLTRQQAVQLLGNNVTAFGSVPLAIFAVLRSSSFAEAVSFAVSCGGDSDTIGAMAGALAGAWYGYRGIPEGWLESLEDGEEGKGFIYKMVEKSFD
jgi:poly(ADP-ribose) glycohydrolase ARH3